MMRFALLATAAVVLLTPHAFAATCASGSAPSTTLANGGFQTFNGQIYTPNGQPFTPRGINLSDVQMYDANKILATFPGINIVRLAIGNYQDPSAYVNFINTMTSHGVVVVLDDHKSSTGKNSGGADGVIFSGALLQQELAWNKAIATAFKNNPYVWTTTNNEPAEAVYSGGPNDPAALSAWQGQQIAAIRGTGNNNPILVEVNGWPTPDHSGPSYAQGYNSAIYAKYGNLISDDHVYNWPTGYSSNPATIAAYFNAAVAQTKAVMKSADGTMPVLFGEVGPSTDDIAMDNGGMQAVQWAEQSGLGNIAWWWNSGTPDSLLAGNGLTAFGQQVAGYIAQGGASGCAAMAISPADILAAAQATFDQTQAIQTTQPAMSVDEVAALALTGPMPTVTPIVRTVASPSGTSPPPPPVTTSTSFTVTTDEQTLMQGVGNATGTISGNFNTVAAPGGAQTVTVTGTGNTITTGPYDDTITVQSFGNTINPGGGNDTVILAYGGTPAINADLPAIPLATAGNILVAPAPGTGVLTIQGTLAATDRVDLTKAMAGSTWDGSQATMWSYISAATSPTGCTISVGGVVVVRLPGGSPSGQLGSFVVAQHG